MAPMGRQFTFERVRRAVSACAAVFAREAREPLVLVACDARMLSSAYAQAAAAVLSRCGLRVGVMNRDIPGPVLAHAVIRSRAHAALYFSAGYRARSMNGLKIFNASGCPVLPSRTLLIEEEWNRLAEAEWTPGYPDFSRIKTLHPRESYLDDLRRQMDWNTIRRNTGRVVLDNRYGSAREYLDDILADAGVSVLALRNYPSWGINGTGKHVPHEELRAEVLAAPTCLGLSMDVDGHRTTVLDGEGRLLHHGETAALIATHLVRSRGMKGTVLLSVESPLWLADYLLKLGLDVSWGPVGYRHLARMLVRKNGPVMVVDGANGVAMRMAGHGHKDGMLAGLLILEALPGVCRGSLARWLTAFREEKGAWREEERTFPDRKGRMRAGLAALLDGSAAEVSDRLDLDLASGALDGQDGLCWRGRDGGLLVRPSTRGEGIRIRVEARCPRTFRQLRQAVQRISG